MSHEHCDSQDHRESDSHDHMLVSPIGLTLAYEGPRPLEMNPDLESFPMSVSFDYLLRFKTAYIPQLLRPPIVSS